MLLKRVIPWGEPDLIDVKDHIDAILTNFNAFDQRTDQLTRAIALCGDWQEAAHSGSGMGLIGWRELMLPQLIDPRPHFANLPDSRRETRNKLHPLQDILVIVLCVVPNGMKDWVRMEAFAEEKEAWLQGFLDLPSGIPSHDTSSDVLGRIDPVVSRAAFTAWVTAALPDLVDEQVWVDGKAVRGSRDGMNLAVHRVSALAGRARWVLAQQAVAEKSNEITTIPGLLALLDPQGAVGSANAMGCQKTIARTIVEGGADSVLALEDNHPTPCEDVQLWLDTEVACGRLPVQEMVEKDHDRIEIRRYAPNGHIDWLDAKPDGAGLQAVGQVESTRIIGDQISIERRYFLSSFADQERFAATVRGHGGIENQPYGVLEVQFGEDACRTRNDRSAESLALIRRIALNVPRHNSPPRDSIRRRKLRAALDDDYRSRLLLGTPTPANP